STALGEASRHLWSTWQSLTDVQGRSYHRLDLVLVGKRLDAAPDLVGNGDAVAALTLPGLRLEIAGHEDGTGAVDRPAVADRHQELVAVAGMAGRRQEGVDLHRLQIDAANPGVLGLEAAAQPAQQASREAERVSFVRAGEGEEAPGREIFRIRARPPFAIEDPALGNALALCLRHLDLAA